MPSPVRAGRLDFADIVRAHRAELESVTKLSRQQRRVLTDIANCRTAALGGHLDRCTRCGYEHPAYNSCRNRHCPKCQALAQEKWIDDQRARMLDVRHFHVVFTLPAELRPLSAFAPRVVYDALFHAAAGTLKAFAHTRLSATIGATLVLHTWTRKLELHPHVHAIVTGGGLSHDGTRWRSAGAGFLFPVKAMSRVFRAKMLAALRRANAGDAFRGFDDFRDPEGFRWLMRAIAKLSWHVYAKPSFSRGQFVLQYLGRYTHRVGLATSRLCSVSADAVTFRTKGTATATVPPVELLRRFVQHVLPDGFHKIRHVGLYASAPQRELARRLLDLPKPLRPRKLSWHERLSALTGRDVSRCPLCATPLQSVVLPPARAPPGVAA